MTSKQSKAKQEYDRKYNARPEQVNNREKRNLARARYERENGDLPRDVDVAHKKALDSGGSNSRDNVKAQHQSENRAWREGNKGKDSYKVKK